MEAGTPVADRLWAALERLAGPFWPYLSSANNRGGWPVWRGCEVGLDPGHGPLRGGGEWGVDRGTARIRRSLALLVWHVETTKSLSVRTR